MNSDQSLREIWVNEYDGAFTSDRRYYNSQQEAQEHQRLCGHARTVRFVEVVETSDSGGGES